MNSRSNRRQSKHLIAGAVSGAVATGITAPLELVKTVLQSGTVQRNVSSYMILKEQVRLGGPRACFRGLCPSLLGIIPHSAAYFCAYESCKTITSKGHNQMTSAAVSAMTAGALANLLTNPIWVVKTKMSSQAIEYPTVVQAVKKIGKQEGFKGFLAGTGASMLGVSHVMIQFPMYESVKKLFADPESTSAIFGASTVSKFAASLGTYPLDVIRTQMQLNREFGMKAALKRTKTIYNHHQNGFKMAGFYRGFTAGMVKNIPATIITLWSYEKIIKEIESFSA